MHLMDDFSLLLREKRRNSGWTQRQLAAEVGTTRNTIYRWEHGDTPTPFFWSRLSSFLGVNMADFVAKLGGTSPQVTTSKSSLPSEASPSPGEAGEISEQTELANTPNDQEQAMLVLGQRPILLVWKEEHLQLDLEQRRLETQEKRLDMHQKWFHLVGDKIAEALKLLDAQEDQTLQKQVTERILFSLEEFQEAHPDEFPIPTFQAIKEVLETIREEQAKLAIQNGTNFSSDDIRQSLKHLDDLSQLGASQLIHLRCVRIHFAAENTTTAERGLIVRQVLLEAFERLRGSSVRTDTALDWQLYNILYYRYFKHHIRHEQVAARLVLSRSVYFRLQREAIEALQNAVLEINAAAQIDSSRADEHPKH